MSSRIYKEHFFFSVGRLPISPSLYKAMQSAAYKTALADSSQNRRAAQTFFPAAEKHACVQLCGWRGRFAWHAAEHCVTGSCIYPSHLPINSGALIDFNIRVERESEAARAGAPPNSKSIFHGSIGAFSLSGERMRRFGDGNTYLVLDGASAGVFY